MKKILLILSCFIVQVIKAQSLSPGGFASLAGSFQNANAQIDFNFGESVIGALSNTSNMLTNGTIQPDWISNAIPLTQLRSIDCGKLNLSPDAQFMAVVVPGASLYQFEFRDIASGLVYGQRITTTQVITPSMVQPALQWNQQYLVRVRVMIGGIWGEYGNTCTIGVMQDPNITGVPFTQVRSQYCNNPNISLMSSIVCNPVSMANRYEFKFTNSQNGAIHTLQSLTTICQLSAISPVLSAGVNYQVQVRARVYTTWGNFGNTCNLNISAANIAYREENFSLNDDNTSGNLIDDFINTKPYYKLTVYPNPFNEYTTLLFETPQAEIINYSVTDFQGRIICAGNGYSNRPEPLMYNLLPGTYLLIAFSESGIQQTSKIIKIN